MAAGFFNALADTSRARAVSAGTQPADRVHPVVVEAMREARIDLSEGLPQHLSDDLARSASLLVTMGCGDACPHVAGLAQEDWPLADPKDLPLPEVRSIRDAIRDRVVFLIHSRGW